MASIVAQAWARSVKAGLKTIEDVPVKYRAEVEALLAL